MGQQVEGQPGTLVKWGGVWAAAASWQRCVRLPIGSAWGQVCRWMLRMPGEGEKLRRAAEGVGWEEGVVVEAEDAAG